nr:MAG TPA: hypothetical protein [Bacteriophage sp.]
MVRNKRTEGTAFRAPSPLFLFVYSLPTMSTKNAEKYSDGDSQNFSLKTA